MQGFRRWWVRRPDPTPVTPSWPVVIPQVSSSPDDLVALDAKRKDDDEPSRAWSSEDTS